MSGSKHARRTLVERFLVSTRAGRRARRAQRSWIATPMPDRLDLGVLGLATFSRADALSPTRSRASCASPRAR